MPRSFCLFEMNKEVINVKQRTYKAYDMRKKNGLYIWRYQNIINMFSLLSKRITEIGGVNKKKALYVCVSTGKYKSSIPFFLSLY